MVAKDKRRTRRIGEGSVLSLLEMDGSRRTGLRRVRSTMYFSDLDVMAIPCGDQWAI